MKAQEKDSDRRADVHVHVQEQVEELAEYGQYVDPVDGALCCYIAVSTGDIIKMTGKFNGTTLNVAHDLYVDGVLRKSCNTASKTVKQHRGIKLDIDSALYQINKDEDSIVIDTQMKVVPTTGFKFTRSDEPESIGTIELRLYVLRTFGVECSLGNSVKTYVTKEEVGKQDDEDKETDEKGQVIEKPREENQKCAKFKSIVPDSMIEFETNCQELDRKAFNSWKKKMIAKRPGEEPWAIFRFHYRSKEAIDGGKPELKLTHDPKTKGKGEKYHVLELNPVPVLSLGARPIKGEGSGSTRTSSDSPLPSTCLVPRSKYCPDLEDSPSEAAFIEEPISKPDLKEAVEPTPATVTVATPMSINPVEPEDPAALALKRPATHPIQAASPETKRPRTITLVETQRQLELVRSRRTIVAKKRSKVNIQLEHYQVQMQEEQERLQKELDEETRAYKDELQSLRDETSMLDFFKCKDEGIKVSVPITPSRDIRDNSC